jgi:heat shock protein HtpX
MFIRVLLFIGTNLAVIALLTFVMRLFGIEPYLTANGLNLTSLMIFSAILGFSGAFISLLMSKFIAKMSYGVQIINQPRSEQEQFLYSIVSQLSDRLEIKMPEVGIYHSPEPNAFATGASRNSSLVAVSSGLLDTMTRDEVEGVLGHEMAHVANGDMVTMTLLQGVLNTFVIFFARIAAYAVTNAMRGQNSRDEGESTSSFAYYGIAFVFEILFGILASMIVMAFSRHREFKADAHAAQTVGAHKMVAALQKLMQMQNRAIDPRGKALSTMKISGGQSKLMALFSSHPPLTSRIEALQNS